MHRRRENPTQQHGLMRLLATGILSVGLSVGLVTSGCGADTTAERDKSGKTSTSAGSSTTTIDTSGEEGSKNIPQPAVPGDLKIAPESRRVDTTMPSFSNPTNITNPLFPVSRQESVLLVGHVDGKPFRTEVTLLPQTRIIEWRGQQVETLVSQYMAYLDGRVTEVAYDFYAQADDGSVWYFGEDVFDFKEGAIASTEGTWLAGKDGPAAMIMPANPNVGDVYRTENSPGFAFEEVTVKSVGRTLKGPLGPVDGGIVVEEFHMDGTTEDKTFAPGYGEFYTAAGGEVEALALAVPTDATSAPLPTKLETLSSGAFTVFDAAHSKDWDAASSTLEEMNAAWKAYRAGEVPRRVEPRMTEALAELTEAVDNRNSAGTRQAALDSAQWSLDLRLRYRPAAEIDLARFDLWAAQLVVDATAGDATAVNSDIFTLDYVRDRILPTLDSADITRINTVLGELQGAQGTMSDRDLTAAANAAEHLRDILGSLRKQA